MNDEITSLNDKFNQLEKKYTKMNYSKQKVTIQKWYGDNGNSWYWLVDSNDEGIDGFKYKWQAIEAAKRWNLIIINKKIIERK